MIKAHYEAVKDIIRDKAVLCAVTKRRSLQEIREYYDAGERIFAENRAQDLKERAAALPSDIRWQFIGHLQRNKVKDIISFVDCIQSLDSLPLEHDVGLIRNVVYSGIWVRFEQLYAQAQKKEKKP